jgi:hypothetical protein
MTGQIVFSSGQVFPGALPLTGGTMSGPITFVGTQTFPGVAALSGATFTGGISATSYAVGATSGVTTTFTTADSKTITVTGGILTNVAATPPGNLVLASSYTPSSSSSTGSVGEVTWDTDYLYFCYAPNTWGRVQIDKTPF